MKIWYKFDDVTVLGEQEFLTTKTQALEQKK